MWTASAGARYRRCGRRCATDVSDAEFALIAPLLPATKRGGWARHRAGNAAVYPEVSDAAESQVNDAATRL